MKDPIFITIDTSGGWFDVLLEAIDTNSKTGVPDYIPRNNRIKEKLTRYKRSDDTIRIYRSEYQDIFYILLENYFMMNDYLVSLEELVDIYEQILPDITEDDNSPVANRKD